MKFRLPEIDVFDSLDPIVTKEQNFDSLLVPDDHVARKKSDSFYFNDAFMLRAHTSVHQADLIRRGHKNFLVVGDVFRRDTVDRTHYPAFHQVEGVRIVPNPYGEDTDDDRRSDSKQAEHSLKTAQALEVELKSVLVDLALNLFGEDSEYRWVDAYFPFTHPSWELEVKFHDEWLEVLGCGVIEQRLLQRAGLEDRCSEVGWAFGLGLERLAMRLYGVPDIRLFWSDDVSFKMQFDTDDFNENISFRSFSKHNPCTFDVSFWLPDDGFEENDFYALVREIGGDLVDYVAVADRFTHPKTKRKSLMYRIVYRSWERTLTRDEVNVIHKEIEREATKQLGVVIR